MKIYCFSGLGADERAFRFINLDPHALIHVKWIAPLESETLESYAVRMSACIDESEPFALLGLSFGGMLVQEIAKYKKAVNVIVLSSVAVHSEMALRMRAMKFF